MASISFPVTGFQPVPSDQSASAPTTAGGPQAVDPNQQDAAQGDTVTISAAFPPAQAAQQSAIVKLEQFSVFLTQTGVQTGQTAQEATTANNQETAQANAAAVVTQVPFQPAANVALPPTLDPATSAANNVATQTSPSATPQQELAQLDQTLQQLGIDPQSISLFNRLGLLLYANDPAALQDLVQAIQTVDQQLGQIGGGTTAATETQGAAQAPLPAALQAQPQASQGTTQITPEPQAPLEAATQVQTPAAPPAQIEAQNQNSPANAAATAFAVQLSFSETQATSQELSAPAQASSQNQSAANATATVAPDQSNNLQVSFQEFQLTFQAVELQAPQQQSADAASSSDSGQNQGLNINA